MKRFDIGKFWKGRKQPISVRRKNSASLKLAYEKGKHKKVWLGKHFSKEHREKLRQSNIKSWQEPKLREDVDRAMTGWWNSHPHVRKALSEKLKLYYISHPGMFRKFMQGGKNSSALTRKTKAGYKVRSIGEQKISDFLYSNKIRHSYESHTLLLEGWLCVPDFFLPKYNCFIEYYGQHPKSWKKKVIKDKLYKKHRIPCIFITPNELKNLPRHLIGDAEKQQTSSISWKRFVVK
jgi:hypothetical protein